VEQGQTSPVIMGGYLTSRLECILCRVKYVLPFVDCSVDMPFLLSLPLRFTPFPLQKPRSRSLPHTAVDWLFDSTRFVMRCIFPYRSGAQYSLLRKHRDSQVRRQHPQMQLCLGLPILPHGRVRPSHRQCSSIHQIRKRSCFPSLDRTALSRLSTQVQSAALTTPASPRQVTMDLQLARMIRQGQCRPRVDLLEAFSAGEDRRIHPGLQATPPDLLTPLFGTAAVSPQRCLH
jgi:hypothetical protein